MENQLYKEGDVIKHDNGDELECVLVQYRQRDGQAENFVYAFRAKAELDAERESQRKVDEAANNNQEGDK